jgi:hypothetical protein
MDDDALRHLWNALKPEDIYDPERLPSSVTPTVRLRISCGMSYVTKP